MRIFSEIKHILNELSANIRLSTPQNKRDGLLPFLRCLLIKTEENFKVAS